MLVLRQPPWERAGVLLGAPRALKFSLSPRRGKTGFWQGRVSDPADGRRRSVVALTLRSAPVGPSSAGPGRTPFGPTTHADLKVGGTRWRHAMAVSAMLGHGQDAHGTGADLKVGATTAQRPIGKPRTLENGTALHAASDHHPARWPARDRHVARRVATLPLRWGAPEGSCWS